MQYAFQIYQNNSHVFYIIENKVHSRIKNYVKTHYRNIKKDLGTSGECHLENKIIKIRRDHSLYKRKMSLYHDGNVFNYRLKVIIKLCIVLALITCY